MGQLLLISLILTLFLSCMTNKFLNKIPNSEGAAKIIKSENSYYALFPSDFEDILSCGTKKFNSFDRFTPDSTLIVTEEKIFRESYYEYLVGPAEKLHPDSTGSIGYYPGEYYISKPVSRRKMIRHQQSEYKHSVKWDRQYIGFINSKGDSLLFVNILDPKAWDRECLGYGWYLGADAALNHVYDVVYNLNDNSITNNLCVAIL